jgi:peptide/nickel transport system ATP-binding protein
LLDHQHMGCAARSGLQTQHAGASKRIHTAPARQVLAQPVEQGFAHTARRRAQTRLIQPIFQDPATSLSPRRRIGQLLAEVGEVLREPAEACRLRAIAMLDRLGLPKEAMEKYPYQLSGGQARRAAIARALLFNPKIIAADEPTAGLDVSVQGDFLNLLQEIRAASDITLLVISHNLAVMRLVANDVAVMHKGRIVEQGAARAVLETPQSDYARALLGAWPRLRAGH